MEELIKYHKEIASLYESLNELNVESLGENEKDIFKDLLDSMDNCQLLSGILVADKIVKCS